MLDAIVIGVGVVGASTLWRSAVRGLRVLGIERFDVPHALGSSHGGSRVTRKAYFEDPRYVPLLHRSLQLYQELEAERGERLYVETGGLHVGAPDHPGIVGTLRSANEHGLEHEVLDAREVARRFPAFRPAPSEVGVVEKEAGVLLAEPVVSALVQAAIDHGAIVRARARVLAIEPLHDRVVVVTADERLEARTVVLATGAWAAGPDALFAPPVPLVVERQVQLYFAPHTPALFAPAYFPIFIHFGADAAFYGLPALGVPGVKICRHHGGETTTPDTLDRELREADERTVRTFLREHVPEADGPLLGARVCMYTNTPDDHFVVGAHPSSSRVLVGCGLSGHGFKLAPVIGEILADHVERGGSALDGGLFSPSRFSR